MMREAKSSGIAWIGTIPKCWETDKLSTISEEMNPEIPEMLLYYLYIENLALYLKTAVMTTIM